MKLFPACKRIIILTALGLVVGVSFAGSAQLRLFSSTYDGAPLIYRIQMLKDTFLLHEPVGVEIWVKNVSDRAANLNFTPFYGWKVRDSYGYNYHSMMHFTPAAEPINPGDSAGGLIGLGHFGVKYKLYPPHFPVGSYVLSYWLFGDSIPSLTFTVIEPQGEEARALELYLKSFPSMEEEQFLKLPRKEFRKLFEERGANLVRVADSYRSSVYAVEALSTAASIAWSLGDKETAYQLKSRIVREYSDPYGNALFLIRSYYESRKNLSAFQRELENIIKSGTDSNLVARARGMLKALEADK